MRCFVTGATGFIGARVVSLLRAKGHDVDVLARDEAKARAIGIPPERILVGDLFAIGKIRDVLKRCDTVFHLAAEIGTQRDARKLWRVDVEGTDAIAEACEAAGVKRLVFASTAVVGEAGGAVLRPDVPLHATTPYGQAKQEAERRLLRSEVPVVIARPSHVYGPGGWYGELVRDFRRGSLGGFLFRRYPGRGDNWWDVVHVDDVASAIVLLGDRGESRQAYHIADDTPIRMRDFFEVTAHALRVSRPRRVPVFLAKILRGSGPIALAVRSARSDNTKLKALGWRPRWPDSKDAIHDVVRELTRAHGGPGV